MNPEKYKQMIKLSKNELNRMVGENTVFPNVSECEHFRHFNFALYIDTLLSELISSHNHISDGMSVFVCVRLLRVLWYCGKIMGVPGACAGTADQLP